MTNFNPKTVTIGNQVWMAENLAIADGGEGITYNEDNGEYYYTWDAALRVAKSIPGWHLPSAIEWNDAALACGATENQDEDGHNYNTYEGVQVLKAKLDVKLAGYYGGSFYCVSHGTYFWSSTEYNSAGAYYRYFNTNTSMDSGSYYKYGGYSVRLVKDN